MFLEGGYKMKMAEHYCDYHGCENQTKYKFTIQRNGKLDKIKLCFNHYWICVKETFIENKNHNSKDKEHHLVKNTNGFPCNIKINSLIKPTASHSNMNAYEKSWKINIYSHL